MATEALIERVYAAFNARDIDVALAAMTEDVSWPKASEGGRVEGKAAIREYWTRQWSEFDPVVHPLEIAEAGDTVRVRVRQVVKNLAGALLFDGEVLHVYKLRDGKLAAMHLGDEANAGAAFAHQ